jgi:hypothetical protein
MEIVIIRMVERRREWRDSGIIRRVRRLQAIAIAQ